MRFFVVFINRANRAVRVFLQIKLLLVDCCIMLKTFWYFKKWPDVKIDSDLMDHCFTALDAVNENVDAVRAGVSQERAFARVWFRHLVLMQTNPYSGGTCSEKVSQRALNLLKIKVWFGGGELMNLFDLFLTMNSNLYLDLWRIHHLNDASP